MERHILKTSSKSSPASVAGALANELKTFGSAEIQAVGAGAVNQAIKAIVVARGYIAPAGKDVDVSPAFVDVNIDGTIKTAIRLLISERVV